MGFATDAIHVGQEPDPATGAIVAPIYQTSTFVQDSFGHHKGFDYARTTHPNRQALERTMARLEAGTQAYVFTSGMAAIDAVFRLLRPGDHAIISEAVYGGVFRLTTQFLVQFGLEFTFVDTSSSEAVQRAIKPSTRMIYVETPTNPTMKVTDIAAIARIANARKLTLVVDNTFLSPYFQQPIKLGARIVVHSMTKYLNGHSDAIGEYRAATRERSDFGDAYWSLANLKTYRFTDAELESMRAAEAGPATGLVDRHHLCFALGKAYEDRGEYAESLAHYQRGNALKRAESRYRPEVIELNTANQKSVCTRKFFEQRLGYGIQSTAPIFVLALQPHWLRSA